MELKVATKEDMDELIILLNTLFSQEVEFEPNKLVQEKGLMMILEDESIGHILVAKDENKICAMVNLLYTVSTALGSKVAILEDMIVLDEYRNKGYAMTLSVSLIKILRTMGEVPFVHIEPQNYQSMNLALKAGFQKDRMINWFEFK